MRERLCWLWLIKRLMFTANLWHNPNLSPYTVGQTTSCIGMVNSPWHHQLVWCFLFSSLKFGHVTISMLFFCGARNSWLTFCSMFFASWLDLTWKPAEKAVVASFQSASHGLKNILLYACFIVCFTLNNIMIYKMNIMPRLRRLERRDWDHTLVRKLFTEVINQVRRRFSFS